MSKVNQENKDLTAVGVEQRWIEQAKQGNQQAATEIVETYRGYTLAIIRYFGVSNSDQLEVYQNVWLSVFRSLNQFMSRGPGSFKGWLSTITRNQCKAYFRESTRRKEVNDSHVPEVEDSSSSPTWEPEKPMVDELKEKLPQHLYQVLYLRYWLQMKPTEMAESLELPVETIYERLRRAKTKAADFLLSYD